MSCLPSSILLGSLVWPCLSSPFLRPCLYTRAFCTNIHSWSQPSNLGGRVMNKQWLSSHGSLAPTPPPNHPTTSPGCVQAEAQCQVPKTESRLIWTLRYHQEAWGARPYVHTQTTLRCLLWLLRYWNRNFSGINLKFYLWTFTLFAFCNAFFKLGFLLYLFPRFPTFFWVQMFPFLSTTTFPRISRIPFKPSHQFCHGFASSFFGFVIVWLNRHTSPGFTDRSRFDPQFCSYHHPVISLHSAAIG